MDIDYVSELCFTRSTLWGDTDVWYVMALGILARFHTVKGSKDTYPLPLLHIIAGGFATFNAI